MSVVREINSVMKSQPTIEGAGVRLKRVFGNQQGPVLDPFLLLDEFHSDNPDDYIKGFPWHPHRGMETITYMLHGRVEHADSLGNEGIISSGGVQWMTAGSGIIHQEMPIGHDDGLMWGFQLWANLPAAQKMMEPRYRDITSAQIPKVKLDNGVVIGVICGEVNNIKGAVQDIVIDPHYMDVMIPAGEIFNHSVHSGYTVFAYVVDGSGYFSPSRKVITEKENLVIFGDGEELIITAGEKGVRFLLISGRPINEPVAWYGPIVMNTQKELMIAFEEYQKGTFLKHKIDMK
jgi:redox-sensitive bicupin YhaK (pirin superfamily)